MSEPWFRLLPRLYLPDFRDELGVALVDAYGDRARGSFAGRFLVYGDASRNARTTRGGFMFQKPDQTTALSTG